MAGIWRSTPRLFRSLVACRTTCIKTETPAVQRMLTLGPVDPPQDTEPPIPPYVEKQGEEIELKRARLLYQSRKRGMLENGLLLGTFAAKHLDSFNESQLQIYDRLINQPTNDWEIYYWITGAKPTPDEFNSEIMNLLKEHAQNKDKSSRIRQPDLYT